MSSKKWGSYTGVLIVGLLLFLGVSALTKSSRPLLAYFLVTFLWIGVGITLDWFEHNGKKVRRTRNAVGYLNLVFDALPYLGGWVLLIVCIYYVGRALMGSP